MIIELLEIIVAVIAAWGLYKIGEAVRWRMMFPRRVRERVYGAVYINSDGEDLSAVDTYVKYLRLEGKIAGGRLIILSKSGIIKEIPNLPDGYELLVCQEKENS
ncbi:MAG: hypothetical protein HFE63_07465 [Clostridiales bacterium]|nr:hypothetical protein [Clostridiales bacterium]